MWWENVGNSVIDIITHMAIKGSYKVKINNNVLFYPPD